MIPLLDQEMFESLLKPTGPDGKPNKKEIAIYFTASWCGACKRLDHDLIQGTFPNIVWYKCDVDENQYTLGYCGLQKIPSFVMIKDSVFAGKFTSSDTSVVLHELNTVFK